MPRARSMFLKIARSRLLIPGASFGVASESAERACDRLRERGGVEPAGHRSLVHVGIADEIGAIGALRVVQAAQIRQP